MHRASPFFAVPLVFVASVAEAQGQQQPPPPAPQPPPAQYQPPPGQYQPPPPQYGQPPPQYGQGYPPPQQPQYQYQPPPPVAPPEPPEPPTHCPKYSLYMGPRLGFLFYGLGFWGHPNTDVTNGTGGVVGNGLAAQLDVGARISYHYIPYVFYEHGFMGKGNRFEGVAASATHRFYGIGIRQVTGDVDSVGFLTDISFGLRTLSVSRENQTYTMQSLALLNIGLGAEIRVSTLVALSPMLRASFGSMSDTEGTVKFADGTEPDYRNGQSIGNGRFYAAISIGMGGHFDIFGK
jgi:hypothetical protein